MKWFVSSDIHSFYDEWMHALKEAGFDINNKDHGVINCGDLCDRAEKPRECLKFINDLHKQGRAIMIRGNHEDLLEDIFKRGYYERYDDSNGTLRTCEIISGIEVVGHGTEFVQTTRESIQKTSRDDELNYYLSNLIDYYETDNEIFVHGWIPTNLKEDDSERYQGLPSLFRPTIDVYNPEWRSATKYEWGDARWLNGMAKWREGLNETGKTIYVGHWHASYGNANFHNDGVEFLKPVETFYFDSETNQMEPHENHHTFKDDGIVALDSCCVYSHFINVEVVEF